MEKVEWRKQEKALYLPPKKPGLIEVPPMQFFAIDGVGDPNTQPYRDRLSALYSLTWSIRMIARKGITPEGYYEYGVYPLEGVYESGTVWDEHNPLRKDALTYTLMIRQPAFVTEALLNWARAEAAKKALPEMLAQTSLVTMEEGLCVQMLHIGTYDDEPASFAQMDAFLEAEGLERTDTLHREIYLTDPSKTKPEANKTVLRYTVRRK